MKLASFDIFDTTLIRKCGSPVLVFELLAKRLFSADCDLKDAFILWRKYVSGETLEDIYAQIDSSFLVFYSQQQLMQAEKEVEAKCLTVNPAVSALIEEKRKDGFQIAFISDMYLDSSFLREILNREGCIQTEDYIYVSCEYHARKDKGDLYDKIKAALHPDYWIHYGDHLHSDVKMAHKKGIHATKIVTGYNNVEKEQQKSMFCDTESLTALSRTHRIKYGNTPLNSFAADFVAPAYLPFVVYVFSEAQRRGIKRLYFLSRDSYILLKAAQVLHREFADIELKYLFVSRRALLLPYLAGRGREAYLDASDHHTIIRIDTIDKRLLHLGTNREELKNQFGITFDNTRVLNQKQQEDFLDKIFNSKFTPTLQTKAKQCEEVLVRYLEQEGIMDGTRSAAVDVGWLGTSRLMLNSILRKRGENDLEMFYYGIRKDVFPPSAGRYTTFFDAGALSTTATGLLEHYYSSSPYPTTIGYEQLPDGKVVPVFPEGKSYCETEIIKANVSAMEQMARDLLQFGLLDNNNLYAWAKKSILSITEGNSIIDFTPLTKSGMFDESYLAKKLTMSELVRVVFLGECVTAFDRASLSLTLPQFLLAPARKAAEVTGRLRVLVYRILIK